MRVLGRPWRELLDPSVGERGQIVDGAPQRCERHTARLIRQRHLHFRAARERLEQCPLGPGEVLEPVGEHGLAVPRVEVGGDSFGCAATDEISIPEPEPVELGAIGGIQPREIARQVARVEQP